ncbi:MAG: hypothetical protein KF810_11540 [Rhizobiaceae bacterium]|nr:hypothetical protein [Rhizobiaceae bacterium]
MAWQNPFAAVMAMRDSTWERHANPWSVWTRVPLLVLFAVTVYFRGPLGNWLWPTLCVLAAFINPRVFPPPLSLDNWASKGVLGERIWLNRRIVPIPRHHARWALGLSAASAACLAPMGWGLYVLDPWAAAFGALGASALKLWFVDRMVWLYEDMQSTNDKSRPRRRT